MGEDNKGEMLMTEEEMKAIIDKNVLEMLIRFGVHLYTTHGFPVSEFIKRFKNAEYPYKWLFASMDKHRDFLKKEKFIDLFSILALRGITK